MTCITGRNGTPVLGIAGWKQSGKTTLIVSLVAELTRRGYRIATVKHAHHDLQLDASETDSARHRHAGAAQVAVVSRRQWAIIKELQGEPEPDLADVIATLDPCDLVIVEGYKSAAIPKIEVRRSASVTRAAIAPNDPLVFAIAADHPTEANGRAIFLLDDIDGLVALIIERLGLRGGSRTTIKAMNDQS